MCVFVCVCVWKGQGPFTLLCQLCQCESPEPLYCTNLLHGELIPIYYTLIFLFTTPIYALVSVWIAYTYLLHQFTTRRTDSTRMSKEGTWTRRRSFTYSVP